MVEWSNFLNICFDPKSYSHNVSCMEVIRYAVQVLLNVAKSEQTIFAAYDA